MSANAGTGSSVETFIAFEQLPPRLRKALTEFPLDMSSEFALKALKQGMTEAQLLKMLEQRRAQLGPFNPKEV